MTGGFSCERVADLASAFIDDELTTAQWLRYRMHLAACGPCKEYVRQLGITVEVLRRLPGAEGHAMRSQLVDAFDAWRADGPASEEE